MYFIILFDFFHYIYIYSDLVYEKQKTKDNFFKIRIRSLFLLLFTFGFATPASVFEIESER